MQLLVATTETQGSSPNDYCWTVEGELVTTVRAECANPRCGCARGFPGLASSRATTTVLVTELPHIALDDLRDAVHASLERSGWLELVPEPEWHELVDEHVEEIIEVAQAFPAGTVLSRESNHVFPRRTQLAA